MWPQILSYPTQNPHISQPFGAIGHPTRGWAYEIFGGKHPGVDFDLPSGTEVFASFSGIVVRNEWHKSMGNVIAIYRLQYCRLFKSALYQFLLLILLLFVLSNLLRKELLSFL